MGYAFISYSSKNQAAADAMKKLLEKNNIATWMAPGDIPPASTYAKEINSAIRNCACMVLMLTNDAQNSVWVAKEVERAVHYRKPVLPIQLEQVVLNDEFEFYISTNQIVAVNRIDESSPELQRVLASIRAYLATPSCEPVISEKDCQENSSPIHLPTNTKEESTLPERISLFELLGIHSINEYDIDAAWKKADITQSLSVPIGMGEHNKTICLDLHQKKDGPNVLIAGPAGSGISEFIRTLFLSLALQFSPADVNFHLIDTSSLHHNELLVRLPHIKYHCLGLMHKTESAVRDMLDEFLNKMFLLMEERKELLMDYQVENIYQYLKLRRNDSSLPPMPHQIIAIDLCDCIKCEHPEQFLMLKLLGEIRAARKFGFHIIFGTHFPEGIVDDVMHTITSSKICSNSSMRWDGDAPSELYVPPCPGRLFIQTPFNPYVQKLQLAYSSENAALHSKNTKELQWFFGFSSQQESIVQAIERHMMD